MDKVLVIGWGNPLRGDDALGWRAAGQLRESLSADCGVTVHAVHQLMPEFAEEISRSDLVIFIDAACDNSCSGEIRFERTKPRKSQSATFSHQLDPPALLAMAQALYGRSPEAYLFTVAGRSFEHGEELSPEVRSALPELVKRVHCLAVTPFIDPDSRKA